MHRLLGWLTAAILVLSASAQKQAAPTQVLHQQPLYFEENVGQAESRVKFLARGKGHTVLISDGGTSVAVNGVQMRLQGAASLGTTLRPLDPLPGRINYLIGNDPAKWHTDVQTYARVERRDAYPGIDVVYYGNERQLEYDLVVHPGVGVDAIRLAFDGPALPRLSGEGDLILDEKLRQLKPVIYQVAEGVRRPVEGGYIIASNSEVSFDVPAYDHTLPLVIDPTLTFSSFLGGGTQDVANGVAVDASGHMYVTGGTSSTDFPIVNGGYQSTPGGKQDVFVTKLTPGGGLVYSTYIGGSEDDFGEAIAIDSSGNAYVTGWTTSPTFPLVNAVQSSYGTHPSYFAGNAFVLALNPSGRGLQYSTYLGSGTGYAVAVDASGNAYFTGSATSTDLPVVHAFQPSPGGNYVEGYYSTVFLAKFGPSGVPGYITYFGGSGGDFAGTIAVDSSGVYIAGNTKSSDFPVANAAQSTLPSAGSAFVTKFDLTGSALLFSTYVGINAVIGKLAIDGSGNIYVSGAGTPTLYPATQTFVVPNHCCNNGYGFIAKILADGSAVAYWSQVSGNVYDLAADASGHVYVVGAIDNVLPKTSPFQTDYGGGYNDAFVAKFNATGTIQVYSSYLGGKDSDYGVAIAIDSQGSAYLVGYINGYYQDFPITFPTVSPTQAAPGGGLITAFLAKVTDSTPFIDSISPASARAGGASFTLTVNGSGFTNATSILWNGSPRNTTLISSTQVTAAIFAGDIAAVGMPSVSLVGLPAESSLTFSIEPATAPAPGINTLYPAAAVAGSGKLSVMVNGRGFTSSSVLLWNGSPRDTTVLNATQLRATIVAADLLATGTAQVSVFNPAPGGGTSGQLPFSVVASLSNGGSVVVGTANAVPGGQVRVPISLNLNPGVTVDNVVFTATIIPIGAAPALSGSLTFEKCAPLPAPTQLDASSPNVLTVFWSNLSTPLSDQIALGNIVANIPGPGASTQYYVVQITGTNISLGSAPVFFSASFGFISVGADYGVSDVSPAFNDIAGNFGDGAINSIDLIYVLRAVTGLPDYTPHACADRFDAMDSYPLDTPDKVGGDGVLNTLDLLTTLRRVTNIDTYRPRRMSRNLSCDLVTEPWEPMQNRPAIKADMHIEIASPLEESSTHFPVYLTAVNKLEIGGVSFSAVGEKIHFTPAPGQQPSLSDAEIPGTVALAWLDGMSLGAGQRVLLGYFDSDSMPKVQGASGHTRASGPVVIGWGSHPIR